MAHVKSKDLVKRTQSDKFLRDKAFKNVIDPNYDGYQRRLASTVYKFFNKKSSGMEVVLMSQITSWQINFINQLLESSRKKSLFII